MERTKCYDLDGCVQSVMQRQCAHDPRISANDRDEDNQADFLVETRVAHELLGGLRIDCRHLGKDCILGTQCEISGRTPASLDH